MRLRIRAIAIAALLAVAVVLPISAPSAFASVTCPSGAKHYGSRTDPTLAVWWETGRSSFGSVSSPHFNALCIHVATGGGQVFISNIKTSIPFDDVGYDNVCDGQAATSNGSWNDCFSGIQFNGGCHYYLDVWGDANFGTFLWEKNSSYSDPDLGPFGSDNAISSLKISYQSVCHLAPAG